MDRFDYENFNFDDAFVSVQSEIKKPNILICGATGVGKSTLIRDLFRLGETARGIISEPTKTNL